MASRFNVDYAGQVIVLRLLDRSIVTEQDVRQIGGQINHLLKDAQSPQILLDFGNVRYLSSSMLGKLIKLNSTIKQAGGRLALCRIDSQVYEVFETTNLKRLFNLYESEADALDSF